MANKREIERRGPTSELSKTISAQALSLQETMRQLNITGVRVSDSIRKVTPKQMEHALMLGVTGYDEGALSMVLASPLFDDNARTPQVLPVLILPTPEGQSLLTDAHRGDIFTDGFWTCQDNSLQFIQPTQPIPLDGVFDIYDLERTFAGCERVIATRPDLKAITENKQITKDILQQAGITVPKGIFIPVAQQQSLQESLAHLSETFDISQGFVVKGNTGSQGRNVKLFDADERAQAAEYANRLFEQGIDVIVEERIIPMDFPVARREKRGEFLQEIDHNSRVITTLSATRSQVIDAEQRFGEKGNNPISVSQGAHAVRLDEVFSASDIQNIHDVATRATQVLCAQAVKDPAELLLGIAGLDIIVDTKGTPYVIEANVGAVGGLSTLTRLDGKPLASLTDIFYPSVREFLQANHNNRSPQYDVKTVKRLPLELPDRLNLLKIFLLSSQLDKVLEQENFIEFTPAMIDTVLLLADVFSIRGMQNNATYFINLAEKLAPQNPSVLEHRQLIDQRVDNITHARSIAAQNPELLFADPDLLKTYVNLLLAKNDVDAAILLMGQFYLRKNAFNALMVQYDIARYFTERYIEIGMYQEANEYMKIVEHYSEIITDTIAKLEQDLKEQDK